MLLTALTLISSSMPKRLHFQPKPFSPPNSAFLGWGNGVLQDILWQAKIHPKRKMADLSEKEIQAMFTARLNPSYVRWPPRAGRIRSTTCLTRPGGCQTILT